MGFRASEGSGSWGTTLQAPKLYTTLARSERHAGPQSSQSPCSQASCTCPCVVSEGDHKITQNLRMIFVHVRQASKKALPKASRWSARICESRPEARIASAVLRSSWKPGRVYGEEVRV